MRILKNLVPNKVFEYFEDICGIPHGSGDTEKISNYCVNFAKEHNLEVYKDNLNNVIIKKEATAGYENSKPVILQGHMDMVCEKDENSDIDFSKDGLELFVDGDFIKAKGTTLGGDDGIALAYALAILDDDTIVHPKLYCVFTVDEETGMFGAQGIDTSKIEGNLMLNIDSEEEGIFLTSCAGGLRVNGKFEIGKENLNCKRVILKLKGLIGGHSGTEINKNHENANKLIGEILKLFGGKYRLINIGGGNKSNVIPNSAYLELAIEDKNEFEKSFIKIREKIVNKYKDNEPNIEILVSYDDYNGYVLDYNSTIKISEIIETMPNGVLSMSDDIEGLVKTSLNLGIMRFNNKFTIDFSLRSNVTEEKEEIAKKLEKTIKSFGGKYEEDGDYPAWEYNKNSKILGIMVSSFYDLFGIEAKTEALHAGLECGFFAEKIKDLDCVSFGPDIYDIHTVNERLSISSVERVYRLIIEVLKRLKTI